MAVGSREARQGFPRARVHAAGHQPFCGGCRLGCPEGLAGPRLPLSGHLPPSLSPGPPCAWRSCGQGDTQRPPPPGDDGSGSGSGEGCVEEACGRAGRKSPRPRPPLTHTLPGLSEQEGHKTSAAGRPQPHAALLLPLLLLPSRWR